MAVRSAQQTRAAQEIAPLPPIKNRARRDAADQSFKFFCEQYFPGIFSLPWSSDHPKVIEKIQQCVTHGGQFCLAMPRGSGKTNLCVAGTLWAILTGKQRFIVLIGATADHGNRLLSMIKSHCSNNKDLMDDYPEALYPIWRLEGESRRCAGQRYYGRLTHIGWNAEEVVFPTIPGSRCSGALVRTVGITGNIRGAVHIRPDGTSVRPSLVLIDDPQSEESARSPAQVQERMSIIGGAILGLAGPTKKIAALAAVTVIRPDDLSERMLDRTKNPQWQGQRTRMLYTAPTNESLWAEYARLRFEGMQPDPPLPASHWNDFYIEHRAEMDAGAVVAWEALFNADEVSAIQHAMNLKIDDPRRFAAEYQNEPLIDDEYRDLKILTADQIARKTNGRARGSIPTECNHVTAFVDVQDTMLFWLVAAWADDFTGYVVDYGAYPDQRSGYFTVKQSKITLASVAPDTGFEGSVYAGLSAVCGRLLDSEWKRDDGAPMKITKALVDINYRKTEDVINQFVRQSHYGAVIMPSVGRYVGASSTPFDQYKRQNGDKIGNHWRIPVPKKHGTPRYVLFDTNYFKSFVMLRAMTRIGDRGCLSLFAGHDHQVHQMLADHWTAEFPVPTEARGNKVDEWKEKAPGRDNHWWDCIVGSAVAASILGVILPGTAAKPRERKRISLSALQQSARHHV